MYSLRDTDGKYNKKGMIIFMDYLFAAAIMFVFYLDFKIISVILKRSAKYFHENKQFGRAEVVGYDASEGSRWYSLIVKVLDLNDNKTYICNSAKVNIHDYPKGTIVDVAYATTKHGRVQVYLSNCLPVDKASMAKVFNMIAIISMIITLGLLIAGVITMIL